MAKKDKREELLNEIDDLGIDIGMREDEMTAESLAKILAEEKKKLGIDGKKKVKASKPLPNRQAAVKKAEEMPGTVVSGKEARNYDSLGKLKTICQVGADKFKITLK